MLSSRRFLQVGGGNLCRRSRSLLLKRSQQRMGEPNGNKEKKEEDYKKKVGFRSSHACEGAGGPSYREAKGGDVQPALLVLLRVVCLRSPAAWNSSLTPSPPRNLSGSVSSPAAPSLSRTLRKG